MTTRTLLITGVALAATAAGGFAAAVPASGSAAAATPRIDDIDADLHFDGRVRLEAEVAGATRVRFTYRGLKVKANRGRLDREDGTRDWRRTVRARGDDAAGRSTVTIKVRACNADGCVTRSERERLELDD
jgi:hypothetical protein